VCVCMCELESVLQFLSFHVAHRKFIKHYTDIK